jgi:CHASE2 domain-containing sensor protein
MRKKSLSLNSLLAGLIALAFVGFAYYSPPFLEQVERASYDAVTRLALPETPIDQRILLIEIDQKSLDKLGSWPWPRDWIARMVHLAKGSGAKVIGLNLPLLDEERNSGLREIRALKEKLSAHAFSRRDDALADWIEENLKETEQKADHELELVEAVQEAGNVILPAMTTLPAGQVKGKWSQGTLLSRDYLSEKGPLLSSKERRIAQELHLPLQRLGQVALGFGHNDFLVGEPARGMAHPLFINHKGSLFPSYALRLALAYWEQVPSKAVVEENQLRLKGESIPLWDGKMLVKFLRGFSQLEKLSFSDILNGREKLAMKGKIVLIGANFGDAGNTLRTPVSAATSEDQFNGFVLDNLLNRRYLSRPPSMVFVEMGVLLLLGLGAAFLFPRIGQISRLSLTLVLIAAITVSGFLLLARWEMWFRMSYVLACLLMIYALVSVSQYLFRVRMSRESIETNRLLGLSFQSHMRAREASVLDEVIPKELTRIGRYEILQGLGRGSMGLVYKALDLKINRLLAIKTIRFSDDFDEDVIQEIKERFFKEAETAGRLSHPCIVNLHDMGEDQDLTYIAMEYLEGESLEKFINKKNLLPLKKVLSVMASVAEALEFAHRANVIHTDIKPANIMLLKTGGVKVTDFGIAKAISSSRTRTGILLGTPNYMSPEQIMGQKADPRSDVFSLGVVFYQLLTGELPFQGDNLSSLLYQITQVKHPPLRSFNSRIPVACEQIMDKALAKNLDERFKTAGQMEKLLRLLALKVDQKQKKGVLEKEAASRA